MNEIFYLITTEEKHGRAVIIPIDGRYIYVNWLSETNRFVELIQTKKGLQLQLFIVGLGDADFFVSNKRISIFTDLKTLKSSAVYQSMMIYDLEGIIADHRLSE